MDLSSEKCFALAKRSRSDIRFGAFIEKNGQIIGFGWNHQSTKKERRESKKIFGKSVDYSVHAEEAAVMMAIQKEANLPGAVLYVMGFLKNGTPIIREKPFFTCRRCAKRVLIGFNLPVRIRTIYGWKELSPQKAYKISLKFQNSGFWKKTVKQAKNKGGQK